MYWSEIVDGDYEFDRRAKKIAALEKITKEDVINLFNVLFFDNPKRINVKFYSHAHWEMKDDILSYEKLNQEFFEKNCQVQKMEKLGPNYKLFKLQNILFPRYKL